MYLCPVVKLPLPRPIPPIGFAETSLMLSSSVRSRRAEPLPFPVFAVMVYVLPAPLIDEIEAPVTPVVD